MYHVVRVDLVRRVKTIEVNWNGKPRGLGRCVHKLEIGPERFVGRKKLKITSRTEWGDNLRQVNKKETFVRTFGELEPKEMHLSTKCGAESQ